MFDLDLALRFGAALGLGLLLGLERERKRDAELLFGGVRTFALIALLGAVGAFMERELYQGWFVLVAFVAVGALVVVSYAMTAARGEVGITTEVTALLAFIVGALCGWNHIDVAAVATVVCLLLLTLKDYLHRLARRVELSDVEATLTFAVISVIILPLLPNETFGPPPLDVINPYKIWLMVVLIAGLNFLGYLLVKVLGNEHGLVVAGLLGGLVSSTAVTLSFSQRSRQEPAMSSAFVLAIVVAWTIMFLRVVVIVGMVNFSLAGDLALTLGLMTAAGVLVSLELWRRSRIHGKGMVTAGTNPFELGEAIKFGLLFGVVTVAAKAAEVYLGETGLYIAGAVAGLTDVDAISLSMANLAAGEQESLKVAGRTILIAVVSNTLTKAGMAVFFGAPALRRTLLLATVPLLIAAVLGTMVMG
ncbi:MAG: MgtC/SapB family protein [Candidatus Binatia bacterium]